MIVWLSQWLRDIIAVILLATIVELLLPNKAMQRYARLVVGLIILLTILSPVLKLMQEDIGSRLEAGIQLWDERSKEQHAGMPSLEDIQRKAAQLQEQQALEAAKLTETALEGEISALLEEEMGVRVDEVEVKLKAGDGGGGVNGYEFGKVTVTLAAPTAIASEVRHNGVKPIEPVSVTVDIRPAGSGDSESVHFEKPVGYEIVNEKDYPGVWQLLRQAWGIRRDNLEVRQMIPEEN